MVLTEQKFQSTMEPQNTTCSEALWARSVLRGFTKSVVVFSLKMKVTFLSIFEKMTEQKNVIRILTIISFVSVFLLLNLAVSPIKCSFLPRGEYLETIRRFCNFTIILEGYLPNFIEGTKSVWKIQRGFIIVFRIVNEQNIN